MCGGEHKLVRRSISGEATLPSSDSEKAVVLCETMVDSELRPSEQNVISFLATRDSIKAPKSNYTFYVQIADRTAADSASSRAKPDFHIKIEDLRGREVGIHRKRMFVRLVAQGMSSSSLHVAFHIDFTVKACRTREGWSHVWDPAHRIKLGMLPVGQNRIVTR